MTYVVVEDGQDPGAWRVEAINYEGDGEAYVTLFYGPRAQARAQEYARFKNRQQENSA